MFSWIKAKQSNLTQGSVEQQLAELYSDGVNLTLAQLMLYQQQTHLVQLAPKTNVNSKMSGNYLSRTKGRGMEFDEVRLYQAGDDVRTIDWRVTARTGKTYTKLFREEVERPVLICTDLSNTMHFGSQLLFKSVQAAHFAALVAWHAKQRGDRVGGIVFNQQQHSEIKPRSRQIGILHYLNALCQLHQVQQVAATEAMPQQFAMNIARLRKLAPPGSLIYLLTDGLNVNQDAIHHLTQLSRHCELVIGLIHDPLELQLPQTSHHTLVSITDGEQQQQLLLGDSKTALAYANQATEFFSQQQQRLLSTHARVFSLSAGQTLATQLHQGISWIH